MKKLILLLLFSVLILAGCSAQVDKPVIEPPGSDVEVGYGYGYNTSYWYPDGDTLKPVDSTWGIEVSSATILNGITATGTSSFMATTTDYVIRAVQGSTGNVLRIEGGTSPSLPALGFGDGDTGFYESSNDSLQISTAGTSRYRFVGFDFQVSNNDRAEIVGVDATAQIPVFVPRQSDGDTGIGRAAADKLSFIAGAKEILQVATGTPAGFGRIQVGSNTSIVGLNAAGTASTTWFTQNASSTLDVGTGLNVGTISAAADTTSLSWMNTPISSNLSSGTDVSYHAQLDFTNILTVFGESDGAGGLQNGRVGVGTSTPAYLLDVDGDFNVGVVGNKNILYVKTSNQRLGIGTSTPAALLDIHGINTGLSTDYIFRIASTTNKTLLSLDNAGNLVIAGGLDIGESDSIFAYATTTLAIASGAWTDITFNDGQDISGQITYSSPTTTIADAGKYSIYFDSQADKTGGGTERIEVVLFVNDIVYVDASNNSPCYSERNVTNDNITGHFGFRCQLTLAVGDEVAFKAQANGSNIQFNNNGTAVTNAANRRITITNID